MKSRKNLLASLGLAWLCLGLAGCQTHTTTAPLANGYEEVSHPNHTLLDEPEPPRIALQYRAADGTLTQIWPSLSGSGEVIHGDLAIFVGDKAAIEPERVTHPRLFAVKTTEMPLEITGHALWRWAKANNVEFRKVATGIIAITPAATADGVSLRFDFTQENLLLHDDKNMPDNGTLQLTWPQIEEIVRAVKANGKVQKDLRWGTAYISEGF